MHCFEEAGHIQRTMLTTYMYPLDNIEVKTACDLYYSTPPDQLRDVITEFYATPPIYDFYSSFYTHYDSLYHSSVQLNATAGTRDTLLQHRYYCSFDNDNGIATFTTFDGSDTIPSEQFQILPAVRSSAGPDTSFLYYIGLNGKRSSEEMTVCTFDNTHRLSSACKRWIDLMTGQILEYSRIDCSYDTGGSLTSCQILSWNASTGSWVNDLKYIYTYTVLSPQAVIRNPRIPVKKVPHLVNNGGRPGVAVPDGFTVKSVSMFSCDGRIIASVKPIRQDGIIVLPVEASTGSFGIMKLETGSGVFTLPVNGASFNRYGR